MDEDKVRWTMAPLLAKLPQGVAASDPHVYEALASGKIIVSVDPEELRAIERSAIPEFGTNFLDHAPDGGFRWIKAGGTKFFVTFRRAMLQKHTKQRLLWELEKLLPGAFSN